MDSVKMVQYLGNHPQGKYVENAKLILDSLEWEKAFSSRDTTKIRGLMTRSPDSRFKGKGEEIIWEVKWPPVKIDRANSVLIWNNGRADILGFGGQVISTNGIPFYEMEASGDGIIYIWRNFSPGELKVAQKISLRTGCAFLVVPGGFKFVRKVDIQESDDQLRDEFGVIKYL
jgi:hypothetical protein